MDYEGFFKERLDVLRGDGRYRVFADLERRCGRLAPAAAAAFHQPPPYVSARLADENWEFDENGLMTHRHASINDLPIKEAERKFHWERKGTRPADHPGLSELGL
jgi:uncharacterized protein